MQDQIALEGEITKRIWTALENGELPARDLPGSLRNVAVSKGIGIDKSNLMRGEPTSIVTAAETTSTIEAAMNKLRRFGLLVEGEAVEVEDPG